jgi:hypothetical protein
MPEYRINIVDSFHKISGKSTGLYLAVQRFKHFDLFRGAFIILLSGYTRSLNQKRTPYFAKRPELSQNIFKSASKWSQRSNTGRTPT